MGQQDVQNYKMLNHLKVGLGLKTDRNLFGKMALVALSRNLDMKEVLKYELGPWSIAMVTILWRTLIDMYHLKVKQ